MRLIFQIVLLVSISIFVTVVELSRRNYLDRTSFFIGVSTAIGLGFFSIMPEILRLAAEMLQIEYTYVLTSTAGILGLLVLNIYTLSKLSAQNKRLNNLTQEIALDES